MELDLFGALSEYNRTLNQLVSLTGANIILLYKVIKISKLRGRESDLFLL